MQSNSMDMDVDHQAGSAEKTKETGPGELRQNILSSIFNFLTLHELVPASQLNAHWYRTAATIKPRNESLVHEGELASLVDSPLRIHISSLTMDAATEADLDALQEKMNHLKELVVDLFFLDGVPDSSEEIYLPQHLTSFTIKDFQVTDDVSDKEAIHKTSEFIKAIGEEMHDLTTLKLKENPFLTLAAFTHLTNLTHLTHLSTLVPTAGMTPVNKNSQMIKFMQLLRSMCLKSLKYIDLQDYEWTPNELSELINTDQPIQLENIRGVDIRNNDMVEVVKKIPTLTTFITGRNFKLENPNLLFAFLPNLTDITVICSPKKVNVDHLTHALSQFPRLIELFVVHDHLTHQHFEKILTPMTELKVLQMSSSGLKSLEFFSTVAHLSQHLRRLEFFNCLSLSPLELLHIRSLESLCKLGLYYSFLQKLDALTLSTMTPSTPAFLSEKFPLLVDFYYSNQPPMGVGQPIE